jgi:5'-3' exonuclease
MMKPSDPTDIDIVIDASSLYARAFFAAQRSGTDPVIAGLRSFLGLINRTKATRAIFCWDGKSKSEKVRGEKPEGYDDHRASFQDNIDWLWSCPQIRSLDHEADDLVATVVYSDLISQEVYVVSGDKDLQQLMDCRKDRVVGYYCLNKKRLLTTEEVVEKWTIKRPSHIAVALAILGDPVDGISGIKGWGPSKVAKLFEAVPHGSTFEEAVLAIDDQIPEPLKQTFYDCLEATILHQDAVLESGPQKLNWRHPHELGDANLGEIREQYSKGYHEAVQVSIDDDI